MKTQIINDLNSLETHDLPVVRFEILFEERKVILELEELNASGEYCPLKLIFENVGNVYTNNPSTDVFQCEGVISIDCKLIEEERVEARVVIDMGHSNPVFVITVVFKGLEIQRSSEKMG